MPWISAAEAYERDFPATKKEIEQVIEYRRRNAKARFYADENFPAQATQIVRANGYNLLTAQEASMRGHPDENHAAFALKYKRILLTCDRDFLDERRFPLILCPALVVCDFGTGSMREIGQTFRCLRTLCRVPQFYDKWTKIDAQRQTWNEYARHLDGTTSRTRYRLYAGVLQVWVD
jgi:predicted nuclease of predicted toxin-antitoxin system